MTQRVSLSIEQWMALREGGAVAPPIWFTVVGGSMRPFIRVNQDQVMLAAVDPKALKTGDIVLFPGKFRGGDYCLHRVYRLDGDRVQTWGDANPRPDAWMPRSRIWGRAALIKRGNRTIDCDGPGFRRLSAVWRALWPIRRLLLFAYRGIGWIKRKLSGKS